MKRIIFGLFVTFSTFAFGVATDFIWTNSHNISNQKSKKASTIKESKDITTELPILAFCELANNPERYDGKIVRVSAKLRMYDDGFKFRDVNCYGQEKEAVAAFNGDFEETVRKITKELGKDRYDFWEKIEIIAIVRFNRLKPTGKTKQFIDNAYLKLEVMNVEKAVEAE